MSKKRALADELAELFNPAPTKEFDPEADLFGAGPALVESDEEVAAQLGSERRRSKEKGTRLRGDIELEGEQYKGRRTSRKAAFGGSESESGSGGSEPEGGLGTGSEEDDDERAAAANGFGHSEEGDDSLEGSDGGSDEDSEEAAGEADLELGHAGAGGSLEDEERMGNEAEGQSDSDDEGVGGAGGGRGAGGEDEDEEGNEMAALEREYAAMQAAEAEAAAGLRERAARERGKALAVQAQQGLWQRGLELRILLQRALQGANKLPQVGMHAAAASHSAELSSGFRGLAGEAVELLGELSELAEGLYCQNAAVGEAAAEAHVGEKRQREEDGGSLSSEQLWPQLDDLYGRFAPFRDASIDRWHRKTTLTTGGTVRSTLRALNQSVSAQVSAMMRDPHKLLQRTRVSGPHSKPLCAAPAADGQAAPAAAPRTEAAGAAYDGDNERDPETFDDTEFYQTLLKEFLEGSGASGGGNWLSGPKQRKVVDRRASKGRKIRYHVHEKLVNFMTPEDLEAPQFAAQLFSNLFGGARRGAPAPAANGSR